MNNKDNQINWDRFESAFYASNTLVDGRYEGVTTSYSVFPSKKDDTPMFSLKVLVDNDGRNHEVAYTTKFNFKNYYLNLSCYSYQAFLRFLLLVVILLQRHSNNESKHHYAYKYQALL